MIFLQLQERLCELLELNGGGRARLAHKLTMERQYTAELLLQAQLDLMEEAEFALGLPRDPCLLRAYALVWARLSTGAAFPGLAELMQQEYPSQPDRVLVGFLQEMANYGSLHQFLR